MNGYGQVYAPGQRVAVGELPRAFKEWATPETVSTVVGVGAGIAIGEWFGSIVSEYFEMESGWAKVGTMAVSKSILSFILFIVGRRTGGMIHIFLTGATIGTLASIIGDVVSQFAAPGFGFGALASGNPAMKGITIKASNNPGNSTSVGSRGQVLTSI